MGELDCESELAGDERDAELRAKLTSRNSDTKRAIPPGDDTTHTEDTAMAAASVLAMDPELPPASAQQEAVQEHIDVFQGDSFLTCLCSVCASPLTSRSSLASPGFSSPSSTSKMR